MSTLCTAVATSLAMHLCMYLVATKAVSELPSCLYILQCTPLNLAAIGAGLLGFVFIKAWVALGNKMGLKMKPFTPQENTVIQTTCVSCYGLAFYGGFATYLFSMTPKIQQVLGDNPGEFCSPTQLL